MRGFRAACAVVLATTLVAPAPAYAGELDDRKKQVDRALEEQHDHLEEASAAVRRAAAALAAVAVALPKAQQRLAAAEGQLAAATARERGARAAHAHANAEAARAEASYAEARVRLERARTGVAEVARAAYIAGPQSYLGVLLDAESPTDFFARRAGLQRVLGSAEQRVDAATAARAEVASRAGEVELRRAAVAARQQEAAAALARVVTLAEQARAASREVQRQVATRQRVLREAERERADDARRYRALQEQSRRLAELIRRASRPRNPKAPVVRDLLWPTPGPVTSGYGYRIHPIYGYRRFHAGIDIGAPSGQGVVAVLGGAVVHAGPMGSYGNLVVVDHGNGFATAYAHLSQVLVGMGARVTRGSRIGLVGSTGASTGPHLHFETRVSGNPVDPMRYY